MRRLVPALSLLVLLAAAPVAAADEQTVTSGPVSATFSFNWPAEDEYTDLRLAVTRAGAPAYDAPVVLEDCPEPYCIPAGIFAPGTKAVALRDLDGDGEPEVTVDFYTGGAHCCAVTEVLRWDGAAYVSFHANWGDPAYRIRDVDGDGRAELLTGDPRFAYAFTYYAAVAFPVQVFHLGPKGFTDVTRRYAGTVRADAKRWKRIYTKAKGKAKPLGVLAAWVADEWHLGRRAAAHRFLQRELARGHLRGEPGWPRRKAFIRILEKRLKAWGY